MLQRLFLHPLYHTYVAGVYSSEVACAVGVVPPPIERMIRSSPPKDAWKVGRYSITHVVFIGLLMHHVRPFALMSPRQQLLQHP